VYVDPAPLAIFAVRARAEEVLRGPGWDMVNMIGGERIPETVVFP
jgi:hypothetical protein